MKIKCLFKGHLWAEKDSVFLLTRQCERCGKEQKYIPKLGSSIGGWTNFKRNER